MKENNLFSEHNKKEKIIYRSYYRDFFKTILSKKAFIIPLFIMLSLFIIGLIFCHFYNINAHLITNFDNSYISPCYKYPFGTNGAGQNQFYMIFIGIYKTLLIAFIATFINLILGVFLGVIWGNNPKTNILFITIKNLVDNTPLVFFYILIVMILGNGFIPLLIAIIIFGWLEFACIVRNTLLLIKAKDYNKISILYNVPLLKRTINNYLPSILPILFNNIAISIPKIISLEIIISYFGFSFSANFPSLGMLIYTSISNNSYFAHPYMILIPLFFLFIINLCIYFISKTISNASSKEVI